MITLLLVHLIQVAQTVPTNTGAQPDIVVTGKRLAEAYAECLEHHCTPAQDAKVTIALAEQRLREGSYVVAKDMLAKAVTRNRKFEKTFPRSLAALYDAYGTVAFHEGDTEVFQHAVWDQVGVLRRNLPATDADVVYARIIVGDMWMTLKNFSSADTEYRAAEAQSVRQGQAAAALIASLRRVAAMMALGQPKQAERLLNRIESDPKATDPAIRKSVALARARLAATRATDNDIDRLAAGVAQAPGSEPVLLRASAAAPSQASVDKANQRQFLQPGVGDALPSGIVWADLGFRIRSDGRTDNVAVLRGTAISEQTRGLIRQITDRRYAARPGGSPLERLERYTFRGEYRVPINSRIRRRWGSPDVTMLDLSEFPAPEAAPAKAP